MKIVTKMVVALPVLATLIALPTTDLPQWDLIPFALLDDVVIRTFA